MNLFHLHPMLHTARRNLRLAGSMLETLAKMREANSRPARALGVLTLFGQVLDLTLGQEGPQLYFEQHGYRVVASGAVADVIRRCLDTQDAPRRAVSFKEWSEIITEYACGLATSHWPGQEHHSWPQPLRAQPEVDVAAVVSEAFWSRGSALEIVDPGEGGRGGLDLRPLPPAGDYVAGPDPSQAATRLPKEGGGSLLLVGLTGCGKSTFARLVAEHVAGAHGRVLRIAGSAVYRLDAADLLDLVRWTKPDVVLLDDLQVLYGGQSKQSEAAFLSLLESLRASHSVLIGTIMVSPQQLRKMAALEPGSLYFDGLRPGRFDDVIVFPLPDQDARRAILAHYLTSHEDPRLDELVALTEGFPGAYLRRLAAAALSGREPHDLVVRRLRAMLPAEDTPPASPDAAANTLIAIPKSA